MKNNFLRLIKSEFKTLVTPTLMATALLLALIPLIGPLASGVADRKTGIISIETTWSVLGRVFSESVMYSMGVRLFAIFSSKSTIDKNRATYLYYKETNVLFAKTLADAFLFLLTIIVSSGLGTVVIAAKGGIFDSKLPLWAILFMFAITVMFVLTSFLIRSAQSLIFNKYKKIVTLAAILLLIVVTYIVFSIIGALVDDYRVWITGSARYYMSFIPFYNIQFISTTLYGSTEAWTVIPFIVQSIAVIIIMWRKVSVSYKEYLCS